MYEKRLKRFLKESSLKYQSPPLKDTLEDRPTVKQRTHLKTVDLPNIDTLQIKDAPLLDIIKTRHSERKYAPQPIPLDHLALMLYAMQGIRAVKKNIVFKTVPSAGASQPFELCVLIERVDGVSKGLYQYLEATHQLGLISDDETQIQAIIDASKHGKLLENASALFILIAHHNVTAYRYSERGIRYLFLDAGHVMQNLYLTAEGLKHGVCAIGHYDDNAINQALSLDAQAFVIYMASLGVIHA